jgi:hypothetical protein
VGRGALARHWAVAIAISTGGCRDDAAADPSGGGSADEGESGDVEPTAGEGPSSGEDETQGPDGGSDETAGEDPPPPPSDNVIDVAIWPRMIDGGHTEIENDPPEVLCRRMALDFTGRVPTEADVDAHCEGKSPEAMARSFMDTPEFVARQRKLWIQHLGPIPEQVLADHIIELDPIIDELSRGTLGYDAFAVRVSAHPGFAINRTLAEPEPYEDSARALTQVFLGRAPQGGELETLARLFRIWRRDWVPRYEDGYGYYVYVATLDPDVCADPVLGDLQCSGALWGDAVSIDLPIANEVLYESIAGSVDPALQTELERVGALLVQQPEFWDEAADHGLRQLLGWWKSTPAQNETDVAEVRSALAAWFASTDGHDVRDLYAMIASSILYIRATDLPEDAGELPPWAIGPTKAMDATQFLDSLEVVFQRELGFCDPHTNEPVGRNWYWPDRLRVAQDPEFNGFGFDFYFETARTLGGCLGPIAEPAQPGLESLFTHIDLAEGLCFAGDAPVPAGFDAADLGEANVDALVQHAWTRFLTRAPLPAEADAIDDARMACASDDTCDAQQFADELCGALLRSGAFLYY